MNIFAPNYYVQSFKTLNIQKLHEMGIQLLLCDIDNTLVAYDEECPNQDLRLHYVQIHQVLEVRILVSIFQFQIHIHFRVNHFRFVLKRQ